MSFIDICREGNLEEAIKLHSSDDIKSQLDWAFVVCCQNGHFDMAEWLYSLGVDIHYKMDWAFITCCKNGELEIAKWLHGLGSNIRAQNDYALRWSCETGELDIAKWLVNLGADIHSEDDDAFIESCSHNNFDVARWLLELDHMIISRCIRSVGFFEGYFGYEQLGISEQSAILFECIRTKKEFPEINEIEDIVLHSLKHYNMIDHLTKLSIQFPYINFEVANGKITEFNINRVQIKSARNSFS